MKKKLTQILQPADPFMNFLEFKKKYLKISRSFYKLIGRFSIISWPKILSVKKEKLVGRLIQIS